MNDGAFMTSPDWNALAALELSHKPALTTLSDNFSISGPALELCVSGASLYLQITDLGVRLSSDHQRAAVHDCGLLHRRPQAKVLTLSQDNQSSRVTAGEISVVVEHEPLSLSFWVNNQLRLRTCTDGHFVRRYRVPPLAKTNQGWWLGLDLESGEPIYGLGEKWGALNKRGSLIRSFNHDALGVNAEISYKNMPFAWSPQGWGLFCHTASPVTHAPGYDIWSQRSYLALVEDDTLDIFVLLTGAETNNHGAELIDMFTELTGKAEPPPRWSNGVILSKAYYRTADEILAAAHAVRDKGMPCDVITFDGRAWQDTDTRFAFEWDASRYPDPEPVIAELKALNFKICVWEYPLISNQHRWFKEFAEKGWLLMDERTGQPAEYEWDRGPFGDVLTPLPTSGIVDFTHPEAYEFWLEQHKPLFDLGVDMIKADFGEQIEPHMVGHNGELGSALHNVYAYLYNRCVYEAAQRYSKSGAFLFSRSSWIGCQRFNSQWGGDPQADWEGMISNIRGGLSWGLSGAPFYATDVGGFYKDTRDDALYVRWAQAGIFSAHFRLHGIGPREPWSYSAEAEQAVMQALCLRYRLLAYLEKTQQQSATRGLPVQRPMVLAFPDHAPAWGFENQFMFGDDLLVAPCFKASGQVQVYFPPGEWRSFNPDGRVLTEEVLSGGSLRQFELALDQIAVFARTDARIPLCKSMQFTDQHGDDFEIESECSGA